MGERLTLWDTPKDLHLGASISHIEGLTQVLTMSPLIALHIQQGVAIVDQVGAIRTERHIYGLTVACDQEAVGH